MFIRKTSGSNTVIAKFKLKKSNNANAKPRNCVCYQVILSMKKISVLQIQTFPGMVRLERKDSIIFSILVTPKYSVKSEFPGEG